MVVADAVAVDLVLPVGVGIAQSLVSIALLTTIVVLDELAVLSSVHHIELLRNGTDGESAVVGNLRCLVLTAFLCGDDDDTVRTAATIDGRGRGVFQYGERLDVVRVHQCQRVVHTFRGVVVHRHAVDDNQRTVRGVQRSAAADTDLSTFAGSTIGRGDVHTGNLTLDHVLGRGDDTVVLLIGLHGYDRAGEVVLLSHTVADDHHVVQRVGVFLQCHGDAGGGLDGSRLVAYVGNGERSPLFGRDGEISVEIGNSPSRRLTSHTDGSADDGFSLRVFHMALYRYLCKGAYR